MRRIISLLIVLAVSGVAVAAQAAEHPLDRPPLALAQAQGGAPVFAKRENRWTIEKLAAVGVGVVAGVVVANAALPASWGIAGPVIGGAVGAIVGNWGYRQASDEGAFIKRAAAPPAEKVPDLFQLAVQQDGR